MFCYSLFCIKMCEPFSDYEMVQSFVFKLNLYNNNNNNNNTNNNNNNYMYNSSLFLI